MEKEQLISEFAAKYLKAKGLTPEDFLDLEGNYKEEYVKQLTDLVQGLSSDEFWTTYEKNPDETIKQLVAQEQDQIAMAKKGAKLLKLKSMAKKCKCGCNMVDYKEDGGKISSKCSCNCSGGKMPKKETGGMIPKKQFGGGQNLPGSGSKPKTTFIPPTKTNLKTPVYKKEDIKLKVKK